MRKLGVGLAAVALLGLVGCGSSATDQGGEEPAGGETAVGGPAAEEVAAEEGTAEEGAGQEAAGFTIRGSLESLPQPLDASYPVAVGDLAAGAQALGLGVPQSAEEKRDWAHALGVASPESAVTFLLPRDLTTALGVEEEPELGFDLTQVSSWVEVGFGPDAQVLTGDFDEDTLSPDLIDLGDGVRSAGEGQDGFTDIEQRTALRPLGQPLRVGQSGDQIVLSVHTATVANWLGGQGPTLAENEALLETADQLDAIGTVNGYFLVQPGGGAGVESLLGSSASPEEAEQLLAEMEQWSISQPFGVVAVGTALQGTSAQDVVVYHFGSAPAAEEAVEQVERAWTDGQLHQGAPVSDLFTVGEVRAEGPTVVALLDRAGARSDTLSQMLISREGPLTHL